MKYHTDIHMPAEAQALEFAAFVSYTRHAKQAAQNDRYGRIDLPKVLDTRRGKLIEAVVEGGKVAKALYRLDYDALHDLCMVVLPDSCKVLTVWLNRKDDQHHTLNEEAYARG